MGRLGTRAGHDAEIIERRRRQDTSGTGAATAAPASGAAIDEVSIPVPLRAVATDCGSGFVAPVLVAPFDPQTKLCAIESNDTKPSRVGAAPPLEGTFKMVAAEKSQADDEAPVIPLETTCAGSGRPTRQTRIDKPSSLLNVSIRML